MQLPHNKYVSNCSKVIPKRFKWGGNFPLISRAASQKQHLLSIFRAREHWEDGEKVARYKNVILTPMNVTPRVHFKLT